MSVVVVAGVRAALTTVSQAILAVLIVDTTFLLCGMEEIVFD